MVKNPPHMPTTPPATSTPFSPQHWQQVQQLLHTLDERQALWLSGYLAAGPQLTAEPASTPATDSKTALIAYGGETGNCEALAKALVTQAQQSGLAVEVEDLSNLRLRQLAKRDHVLVICSTHGDGDPPEPIQPFYEALMAERAPRLEHLHFSVLALGDSSYEHFCVTGQELDQRFAELGATRLHPRIDCDVDYEKPAADWAQAALKTLPQPTADTASTPTTAPAPSTTSISKQNPLTVEVLENLNLSAPTRSAPIHHIELALDTPDLSVSPGDAVGVLADNPPALIAAVLNACDLSGEAAVAIDDAPMPLVQALRQHRDLTITSPRFLEWWAELSGSDALQQQAAAPSREQRQFLKQVQLLDMLHQAPATPEPQALVDALRPLQPRLYDVANSLNVLDDELHLNVKAFYYDFAQRREAGIASHYLLDLQPGDSLRIYPHRNARFHLPEDAQTPVILIAEGTGIAPYRAFIQELQRSSSPRPCWLVFAEQQFEQDFLYQSELQQAKQAGTLSQVDAVFHQDQPEHSLATPLLQQSKQLKTWLDDGAHVYLCGDKQHLTACEDALSEHLGKDAWKPLTKAKRVHRNLY